MTRKAIVVFAVIALLTGCSGYKKIVAKINAPPLGCEDSLVYQLIPQPNVTMLLSTVPYQQMINNEGYLKWAREINSMAIKLLDDKAMTYGRFAIAIVAEASLANQWWGSTLVNVADILSQFIVVGGNKVITDCDRSWLQTWARNALAAHGSASYSFFDRSPSQDNDTESRSRICGSITLPPGTVS